MRFRKTIVGLSLGLVVALSGVAHAADIADKQGWCKKQQGNSGCAGGSECSTRGRELAPNGQAKKC